MPQTFVHELDTALFKGTVSVNTSLYINGQWVDPVEHSSIEYATRFFFVLFDKLIIM